MPSRLLGLILMVLGGASAFLMAFVAVVIAATSREWKGHWRLADSREVEILNVIDDHSRLLVASDALAVFKAADVVGSFHGAAAVNGFPAQMLTDIQPESTPAGPWIARPAA